MNPESAESSSLSISTKKSLLVYAPGITFFMFSKYYKRHNLLNEGSNSKDAAKRILLQSVRFRWGFCVNSTARRLSTTSRMEIRRFDINWRKDARWGEVNVSLKIKQRVILVILT